MKNQLLDHPTNVVIWLNLLYHINSVLPDQRTRRTSDGFAEKL